VATENATAAAQSLRVAKQRMVSSGVAAIPQKTLGFAKGFLARDPDGHGLLFIER
jgi:hypothetical protein